ncbi:S8/S53 family peptidase [Actinoplanes sp. LDG1-06]|uniref:S8/S53 family peptidase n=2 Tax=Paractinoplanes ovalisporus TaxID=2810368 RepID=A0ABS2ALT0_9ACTN|nr:S8/S53 family peptidase [Actinoplanes ovalisporus]
MADRTRVRPPVDFTTLAGPLERLTELIALWGRVTRDFSVPTDPPVLLPVPASSGLDSGDSLRLAQVRHGNAYQDPATATATAALGRAARHAGRKGVSSPQVVAELEAALARLEIRDVVAEEGYFYRPATTGTERYESAWTVRLEEDRLRPFTSMQVPLPAGALGADHRAAWPQRRRIILIDTGDQGASSQVGFATRTTLAEEPVDYNGHGTATGSLLRWAAPGAEVQSFRITESAQEAAESSIVLNALNVALQADRCEIVVLPLRADLTPDQLGQRNLIARIAEHARKQNSRTPVVVCAAGNRGPDEFMSYPALLPGALVAVATDETQEPADYNCPAPPEMTVHVVPAFGGVVDRPVGHLLGTEARTTTGAALYGTSFAAVLVAAALATA